MSKVKVRKVKKSKSSDVSWAKVFRKRGEIDYIFLSLVLVLLCFGLIMVMSASAPTARTKWDDPYHLVIRQFAFAGFGLIVMMIVSRMDYNVLKKYAPAAVFVSMVLLILVLIPGIGVVYNKSRRWIEFAGIRIQPSELMKISLILYIARFYQMDPNKMGKLRGYLGSVLAVLICTTVAMMFETHMSGAMIIALIALILLQISGARLFRYLLPIGCVGAVASYLVLRVSPNRMARLAVAFDPFKDLKGIGWQVGQSLYAISSGGLFGLGIGNSRQKYGYLPEAYNDFIFSVIAEECGFFGVIIIIGLFLLFMARGIKIAMEAPDRFSSLMVVGIILQVTLQAMFNIAVATASFPNTGMSLPFFSYGGTALVILLAEMGVVLSVSRVSKRKKRM